MKTHRIILIISFIIGTVSLLFVAILPQQTKLFQVFLAFAGSSFISFLLELPNFISIKKENFHKLYYALNNIKLSSYILLSNINDIIAGDIATEKFYTDMLQKLATYKDNLREFDSNYYFLKNKNNLINGVINSVCNAYHNIEQAALQYTIRFYDKQITNLKSQNTSKVSPNDMINELNSITENIEILIKIINMQVPYIFTKQQHQSWLIDEAIIINTNNNMKIKKD